MTDITEPLNLQRPTVVFVVRDRVCRLAAVFAHVWANKPTIFQRGFNSGMRPSALREAFAPLQRIGAQTGTAI